MAVKSSIFDIIVSIMIGPSCSHTAGGENSRGSHPYFRCHAQEGNHSFYNSFARTYQI